VLHGSGASVYNREAWKRISDIRDQPQDFAAENIFNMEETGPFNRCLLNHFFFPSGQRRVARGAKAMKANERVTMVSA